ncbi:MAG: hypothetical protein ACRD0K_17865, partial [Egibacteraceae bacterium]
PWDVRMGAILTYVWNMAMPPIISSYGALAGPELGDPASPTWVGFSGKLADALEGKTNRYGEQRTTLGQAAAAVVGINVRGVGEGDLIARIKSLRFEVGETRKEMRLKLSDQSLSPAQRERIQLKYTEEIMRRVKKIEELTTPKRKQN